MPRIMAIGALGSHAVGVGAYPQDFGPWVQADDVDAALARAGAQMQTGRPPGTPVSYKFLSDSTWTEQWFDASTSQSHTVDHVDATGAPLLRAAYESILQQSGAPIVKASVFAGLTWPQIVGIGAAVTVASALVWWFMRPRRRRRRR